MLSDSSLYKYIVLLIYSFTSFLTQPSVTHFLSYQINDSHTDPHTVLTHHFLVRIIFPTSESIGHSVFKCIEWIASAATPVMQCYVMLYCVMSSYVISCYVVLCYIWLCYVMLCWVMLYHLRLCYVNPLKVTEMIKCLFS